MGDQGLGTQPWLAWNVLCSFTRLCPPSMRIAGVHTAPGCERVSGQSAFGRHGLAVQSQTKLLVSPPPPPVVRLHLL